MSAPVASSRSRQTARRKPNDDAGYFGPLGGGSTAGAKRHAADKADGEPRVKRKRVEAVTANAMGSGASKDTDADGKSSLVSFLAPLPLDKSTEHGMLNVGKGRLHDDAIDRITPLHDDVRPHTYNHTVTTYSR